jgi:alcohol dehydrogenase class IV
VCAALLPHVTAVNIRALRERMPMADVLHRYDMIGLLLAGHPNAGADDAVSAIERLCQELQVPPLRTYGITAADVSLLVEKAQAASSMKANPIALTSAELTEILDRAI